MKNWFWYVILIDAAMFFGILFICSILSSPWRKLETSKNWRPQPVAVLPETLKLWEEKSLTKPKKKR